MPPKQSIIKKIKLSEKEQKVKNLRIKIRYSVARLDYGFALSGVPMPSEDGQKAVQISAKRGSHEKLCSCAGNAA